jgi:hypothetical protein
VELQTDRDCQGDHTRSIPGRHEGNDPSGDQFRLALEAVEVVERGDGVSGHGRHQETPSLPDSGTERFDMTSIVRGVGLGGNENLVTNARFG